jgi:hypothetical protein
LEDYLAKVFKNPTLCMAFSNGSRLLALGGGEDGKLRFVATAPF